MMRKLLWWCAGADLRLLEKSTYNDKQRFLSIGATVIISSILSAFSAYYAFKSITGNEVSSIVLGLMWGILITSLNRLNFAAISSRDKSFNSRIMMLAPRLVLSILIAITLSFPFQLKLFENSINNRILQDKEASLAIIEEEYQAKITNKKRDKAILEVQYINEISGKGTTGVSGDGLVAKTLKERIQSTEIGITNLIIENQKYRQEVKDRKIDLLERIETLNKLRKESTSMNLTYITFLLLFVFLELTPIILKLFFPKSYYDILLENSEYLHPTENNVRDINIQVSGVAAEKDSRSLFESYCNRIITDLEFQINKNRIKASELLRNGIIIIISGILCYIGVAYFLVGVFLETHEFKPHYIYFMISLSLLFIFIQFLGGWFLKQYRRTLNTSLYLNAMKPNLDKYLLSYYAICEFGNTEERKNLIKDFLLFINNEFKNLDGQLLNSQEDNFAKDVVDSINSLKETLSNLTNKIK
jgi:hypothetical protein